MMIVRNIKIDVTPEAERRIAELGLGEEFARVFEYTRSTIPSLSELRVETWIDYGETGETHLRLIAVKDAPHVRRDPERRAWEDHVIELTSSDFRCWVAFNLFSREIL